jgi:hypothetical protein
VPAFAPAAWAAGPAATMATPDGLEVPAEALQISPGGAWGRHRSSRRPQQALRGRALWRASGARGCSSPLAARLPGELGRCFRATMTFVRAGGVREARKFARLDPYNSGVQAMTMTIVSVRPPTPAQMWSVQFASKPSHLGVHAECRKPKSPCGVGLGSYTAVRGRSNRQSFACTQDRP